MMVLEVTHPADQPILILLLMRIEKTIKANLELPKAGLMPSEFKAFVNMVFRHQQLAFLLSICPAYMFTSTSRVSS